MLDNLDPDMVKLILACVGLLSTLLTGLGYLLRQVTSVRLEIRRVGEVIEENTKRTQTYWEYQLSRGEVEATEKGLLTKGDQITQEALGRYAWLVEDLQKLAHSPPYKFLSQPDLAVEIERRWGRQIVERVCKPLGISNGACLVLALRICQMNTMHLNKSPINAGGEGPATPQGGGG